MISKEEFKHILQDQRSEAALRSVGVDTVALVDFADYLFQSDKRGTAFNKKLSSDDFLDVLMQVRGVNPATVRDIVDLRKFIQTENTLRNLELSMIYDNQVTVTLNQARILKFFKSNKNGSCGTVAD